MGGSTSRVYFGLGSNLGDRWSYLSSAVFELGHVFGDLIISPIYETSPVGGPTEQGRYLNAVIGFQSDKRPDELLAVAQSLEERANRVRLERFGPRTLDVDVLWIEGFESDDPVLTVPHPRMWERSFVLAPLEDLDPSMVPPGWRERFGAEAQEPAIRRVGEFVASTPLQMGQR